MSGDTDKSKILASANNVEMKADEIKSVKINQLTSQVIGAAIEVHKALGPGLLESVYEECLCFELKERGIGFHRQETLPVQYKNVKLDCGYGLDLIVESKIILELKACEKIDDIHRAQLLTYLKLSGLKVGLIINFNVPILRDGLVRIVNKLEEDRSCSG